MDRHVVRIEQEECLVDATGDSVTIGSVDAVVEAVGGEEYVLQYDDDAASTPWLSTDADGTLTVDVRSAMDDLPLPPGVTDELSSRSQAPENGPSERVRYFAAVLQAIWDAKGRVGPDELVELELE
jgi:hypothetical protein